jgi:hypothetical protein
MLWKLGISYACISAFSSNLFRGGFVMEGADNYFLFSKCFLEQFAWKHSFDASTCNPLYYVGDRLITGYFSYLF